jgi:uncharacterized membrane protein
MTHLERSKIKLEKSADKATRWIGSTRSLIVHTILFLGAFSLPLFGISLERVLLVLTTLLSLEAIYLAIFIQMSVNKNTKDIEIIQEDVEEIQEDIERLRKVLKRLKKMWMRFRKMWMRFKKTLKILRKIVLKTKK